MKIYVAGKTHDWKRVRWLQGLCMAREHEITFDWTRTVEAVGPDEGHKFEGELTPEFKQECATNDMEGVRQADLVIMLVDHPNITGTLVEFGLALAWHKEIWLIGRPPRDSVFFYLAGVHRLVSMHDLLSKLPSALPSGPGWPD